MSAALKMAAANTRDIVDVIQSSAAHTKFLAAMKATGLAETFRGAGPLTLFAPSNDAFNKLPNGAFDGLLKPKSKDDLVHILKYHAIAGRLGSEELAGKKLSGNQSKAESYRLMEPQAYL